MTTRERHQALVILWLLLPFLGAMSRMWSMHIVGSGVMMTIFFFKTMSRIFFKKRGRAGAMFFFNRFNQDHSHYFVLIGKLVWTRRKLSSHIAHFQSLPAGGMAWPRRRLILMKTSFFSLHIFLAEHYCLRSQCEKVLSSQGTCLSECGV